VNISRRDMIWGALGTMLTAPGAASAQSPSAPTTLRVGSQPAEFTADLVYGIEEGFFQRNAIAIELQLMANGAATNAAIIGGSLDIGLSDPLAIGEAHLRGVDLVYIAPGAEIVTPQPFALVTRPDVGIHEAADFNGKTIGTNSLKNGPTVMTFYWLDHNGADSQSIKWVEVPFQITVGAIVDKRIDAALMGEPFLSQARDAGLQVVTLDHNSAASRWMTNGWVARRSWADRNVDTVRRFSTAIRAANRWANTHTAETFPIVARFTKLPESTVSRIMRHPWLESLQAPLVQPVLDTCAHYGVLSRSFPAREIFYEVR
jgi:NitT/TauT family transport system substrate-binding protein